MTSKFYLSNTLAVHARQRMNSYYDLTLHRIFTLDRVSPTFVNAWEANFIHIYEKYC